MISSSPRVTVLMTAFNTEKYISEAIQSILNQSYTQFELLIINDASTDNTLREIEKFTDNRISVLNNTTNKGVVISRNRALTEARGEFIAIMDSDDIAVPNRLASLVNKFDENPHLALIGTHARIIDSDGNLTGATYNVETNPQLLPILLFFGNSFAHSSVMMKSNVFREFGGYRIPLSEDYDLFFRISTKYSVLNIDEYFLLYREHPQGISKKYAVELENQIMPIKGNILKILGLPSALKYQKMLTSPFEWPDIKIKDYKNFYIQLFDRVIPATERSIEVKKFIFEKWYDVIMKNGGRNTVILFFSKPFFSWGHITFKQFRRAFKRSIKNILKKQK